MMYLRQLLRRASTNHGSACSQRRVPTALWLAASLPFAYHVHEHTATSSLSTTLPIAENECAEKKWDLESGAYAINDVQIDLPGLTYVSHEQDDEELFINNHKMGSVRVSGDSLELVECVEVVPLPPNGVSLRFKSKECADLRGHLLTSISLAKAQQVHKLQARGGGVVVVEERVLVTDCEHATVQVSLEGSGQMHVVARQNEINLKKLQLSVAGNGKLQFLGPEKVSVRDHLLFEVAGSGVLHAFANRIDTSFLKTSIAGSGNVCVASSEKLQVGKLKTAITGTGKAEYAGDGQCRVQRCSITGSGQVDAPQIQCEDASVATFGEADVTWKVDNTIKVSGWGNTTIRYVGEPPKCIDGKSVTLRPAATESLSSKPLLEPQTIPLREAAFTEIQAMYESKLAAIENATSLGSAVRFLANAFVGADVRTKTDDAKTKNKKEKEKNNKE